MGRQKIQLDPKQIEDLAAKGLTNAEICACLGISERTLYHRKQDTAEFADAIKKGQARGAEEVANALFQRATVKGDTTAIIWYEKTRRGISDKQTDVDLLKQFIAGVLPHIRQRLGGDSVAYDAVVAGCFDYLITASRER